MLERALLPGHRLRLGRLLRRHQTARRSRATARRRVWATGLVLGLAGVVAVFLPKAMATEADPSLLGTIAVIGMALSYATGVLMNRTIFVRNPNLHPFPRPT